MGAQERWACRAEAGETALGAGDPESRWARGTSDLGLRALTLARPTRC